MPKDKQLANIKLEDVLQKRRLEQALNAKEFALLAGISYSTAREWFRQPGFPNFRGVVFWQDFERWRIDQLGFNKVILKTTQPEEKSKISSQILPARARMILAEAGA